MKRALVTGAAGQMEVIKKEPVFSTPFFVVYRETVKAQNGISIDDFYTISQPDTVMVLPIVEGNVLLVHEYKYARREHIWQLPAGKIEGGEEPEEAVRRELLEETGYGVETLELLGMWYIDGSRMSSKIFIFVGIGVRKISEQECDPAEEIVAKEIPSNETIKMVLGNEIKDPHSCIAILWAERKGLI